MPDKPLTILLAEDEPADAELFKVALKQTGVPHRFHWARDGQEAIDYLAGRPPFDSRDKFPLPDVLITDLKMPRFDGFDLLRWLQQHPEYCMLPTVVMSGSGLPPDVKAAYRLGANSYIEKPTELQRLIDIIRQLTRYWSLCKKPDTQTDGSQEREAA